MITNFPNCLGIVLREEGGFSDNPDDPGHATMEGVTQAVYNAYRHSIGATPRSVATIAMGEVQEIYQRQYWDAVRGDILPKGLDLAVFDYAVNSGPVRAVMGLQKALGVEVDGQFGIITATALPINGAQAAAKLCQVRLSFLEQLITWRFFQNGWKDRVRRIATEAQGMAQ